MANNIEIIISGDKSLQQNVEQVDKIEKSVEKIYQNWQKIGGSANEETIQQLKKMTTESEKYRKEISNQAKEQQKLQQLQEQYTNSLRESEKVQKSETSELVKLNAQIEALKINQKLLIAEGKKASDSYVQNSLAIKDLSGQYRILQNEQVKETNSLRTIEQLNDKQNLTLKEQKILYSALTVQYDKLITKEGKATTETQQLAQRMDKLNSEIKQAEYSTGRFQRNVGNYPKIFQGAAAAFGAVTLGATALIGTFRQGAAIIKRYIDSANAQILAERKLSTILKERTGANRAEIKSIIDLTAAQQKLGVIGDEVQIAGLQQLGTFANQTDTLKTLLPEMNNLIAQQKGLNATQEDAVNIANALGKGLMGQVGALTRYGISLTDAQKEMIQFGSESERAAVLAQALRQNVGNMNEELAKTDSGKIQQAKNDLGDMGEQIGSVLLPIVAKLLKAFVEFSQRIFKIVDSIGLLKDETDNLTDSERRFEENNRMVNETISKERVEIEKLLRIAKNDKRSKEERTNAIKQLNAISPEYLGNITEESIRTGEATTAINAYIDALEKKTKAQIATQTLNELYTELAQLEIGAVDSQMTIEEQLSDGQKFMIENALENGKTLLELQQEYASIQNFEGLKAIQAYQAYQSTTDLNKKLIQELNDEITRYSDIINELGISFDNLTTQQQKNLTTNANTIKNIDIYALKVSEINKQITEEELKLRQKYKTDTESIDIELLKFRQLKQLELLQFIEDNNISDKKVENDLKYLDISEDLKAKELEIEQKTYDDKLKAFQDYQQRKELANEKELLELKQKGAEEIVIELETLTQKRDLLEEYQKFLQDNANAANEIERLSVANQLIDIDNQITDFLNSQKGDDNFLTKLLGVDKDGLKELGDALGLAFDSTLEYFNAKLEAENAYLEEKKSLIEEEINAENEKLSELQSRLDEENQLRDANLQNDALLTETLIRQSQDRIANKKAEEAELTRLQAENEAKLKRIQKIAIYTQFAVDNAAAISSLIKFAFANPLNAVTSGAAGAAQLTAGLITIAANFANAKAKVKQLRKGGKLTGKTHEQGGIPLYEAEGDEYVVNKQSTAKYESTIDAINKNKSKEQILSSLNNDFGQKGLTDFNLMVNYSKIEIENQNKILREQAEKLKENNNYLKNLVTLAKNSPVSVPTKTGYKLIYPKKEVNIIQQ